MTTVLGNGVQAAANKMEIYIHTHTMHPCRAYSSVGRQTHTGQTSEWMAPAVVSGAKVIKTRK